MVGKMKQRLPARMRLPHQRFGAAGAAAPEADHVLSGQLANDMRGVNGARLIVGGGEQRVAQPFRHGVAENGDVVVRHVVGFGMLGEHTGRFRKVRADAGIRHREDQAKEYRLEDEIADDGGYECDRGIGEKIA